MSTPVITKICKCLLILKTIPGFRNEYFLRILDRILRRAEEDHDRELISFTQVIRKAAA
ncbi:hypothetical protein J4410_05110 [Candidatus Woesearchaeota archaeon]|nr:hypothetical protein [Candidatus Woesearchaeota archaeon]